MKNISLLTGYLFLLSGVITGIAANGYLKTTEGFTKINPTIFCLISIVVCMFSLSKAMTIIPVGFTYATYGALTITAVTLFGVFKYDQSPNIYGVIGLALIILGVVLLNTFGGVK
jgi:small multidrug resistance pump